MQLTAEIETTFWAADGPEVHTKTWTTKCGVGTNMWRIEGDPFGELLWQPGATPISPQVRLFKAADGNPGQPVGKADLLSVPGKISWLAFCSGVCLRQDAKHVALPDDLWKEFLPDSWETSKRITAFEDDLGLPERLVLYHESQPVLQYRVTGLTNVLGWTFPLEFYLAQYRPTKGNAWELNLTAKGRIVAITEETNPEGSLPNSESGKK